MKDDLVERLRDPCFEHPTYGTVRKSKAEIDAERKHAADCIDWLHEQTLSLQSQLAAAQEKLVMADKVAELADRLCDAYELVCSDTGMNYHQSPSSVYERMRHALAALGKALP